MTDRPLTVRQVAERAGISRYAVYDAIRDGKLIAMRFSPKLLRVQPAEVDRWLNGASTKYGESHAMVGRKMSQALKAKRQRSSSTRRREPTHADYNDEISDKLLEEIRRVAASKDEPATRWETVREPAW